MALTKLDLLKTLREELPSILSNYGVVTKTELHTEILASEKRTDIKLKKLERSLTIKITKAKNDVADRIANVALAKEERTKVERIDKRVTTLENFVYA